MKKPTKNTIMALSLVLPLIAACSDIEPAPMYSPVNTEGNQLQTDTGPIEKDLNDEFCPPDAAVRNHC